MHSLRRRWLPLVPGLILTLAVIARGAEPGGEYLDPSAVLQRFTEKLVERVKSGGVVPPAELARQVQESKTFPLLTLPDPGVKIPPQEIYRRACPSVLIVGAVTGTRRHHPKPKPPKPEGPDAPPDAQKEKPQEAEPEPDPEQDMTWRAYCAAGFVIHRRGVIVTNKHLVQVYHDMKAIGAMTYDGRMFTVQKVLAVDKNEDLVVLQIDADDLPPLPVATQSPIGAPAWCLAHPVLNTLRSANAFYAFLPGSVSGKYRMPMVAGGPPIDVLTLTTDYAVGASGGPILNEHGAVMGIACQTLSVFYDSRFADVQMIWKFGRPATSLLQLLK